MIFARGGKVLVTSEDDAALVIRGTEADDRRVVDGLGTLHDLAAFGDDLWIAADGEVLRYAIDDAAVRDRIAVPRGPAQLRRCLFGPAAGVWVGGEMSQPIAMSEGRLTAVGDPLAGAVIPLGVRRALIGRGDHVALHDPAGDRWRVRLGRWQVLDGSAVFGGNMVALVLADPSADPWSASCEKQLMLMSVRDGGMQYSTRLAGITAVRFAPLRGLALLRGDQRTLILFDLRFGKVLRKADHDADVADLAIDDAGQMIAVRSGGEATLVPANDLVQLTTRLVDDAGAEAAPAEPEAWVEPTREEAARPIAIAVEEVEPEAPVSIVAPAGLLPRPAVPPLSRQEVAIWLEWQRRLVVATVTRAIARAWDTGRLAFPNESSLAFESEVLGILGKGKNRAQVQLRTTEEELEISLAQARLGEQQLGGKQRPLAALCAELELSTLSGHLLLLVAAPQLWGEVSRLYAILANDEQRRTCDEALLAELAGDEQRYEVARALSRDGALVRSGAIRVGGDRPRPFARLTVDPVVIQRLRGEALDLEMDEVTRHVPATRRIEELIVPRRVLEHLRAELGVERESPVRLVVRGREGSGRRTLLASLAHSANRELGVINVENWLRDPRANPDRLLAWLQSVALRGWLPCLENLDAIESTDRAISGAMRDVLRAYPGPLALRLGWDVQPPLEPGYLLVDLPPTTELQRDGTWRKVLARHDRQAAALDEIVSRYRVGPGTIERVVTHVTARSAPGDDVSAALDDTIRQYHERRLGATATRVTRLATWAGVVLPPDVVDSLLELIARVRHRKKVYDAWGFDRVMSTSRGLTALFQGGPGTGKTMVAGVIANELGLDLYRVDLSRVMSKWIGETERNLASVFDAAEDSQAIILFDEADSLFSKRTEVRTSVDRYANLETNYLLQRLDSFEGIAILTTNFGTAIDNAFKRRLSFRLTFPFPDEEAREQLWRAHIPTELPLADALDFAALARRYQMSGGYIRNAVLRAAFLAALEESPLRQEHLERAVKLEYREMGKLGEGGQLE